MLFDDIVIYSEGIKCMEEMELPGGGGEENEISGYEHE